jgi:endonuclease YncB( thermonuclease family)
MAKKSQILPKPWRRRIKLSAKDLIKKGVPYILIPGILAAAALGWKTDALGKIQNYYQMKTLFPSSGIVSMVEDGDTFTLKSGIKVRLIGINTPERGQKGYSEASKGLTDEISGKRVYLEYDRYQDDKYGRLLAWVWINCESTPRFLPADYMHKSGNESMPGLIDNPSGCKKGKLVNEELIKVNLADVVSYQDRGKLKYESRINELIH